jgi:hypothetical protein
MTRELTACEEDVKIRLSASVLYQKIDEKIRPRKTVIPRIHQGTDQPRDETGI